MIHNDAVVATDLYVSSGVRAIHDDTMSAADFRMSFRSMFPRAVVDVHAPQRYRYHQDQKETQ
ncbi:MAG: hypothetical protein WC869_03430 [Phycisphaerae bacterium]|jgi:hypothetical protein